MVRFWALLLTWILAACAVPNPEMGGVRLEANVPDATLYIDDEERGPIEAFEGHYHRLSPGSHQLRLEHADYRSESVRVHVVADVAVTVTVEMDRRGGTTLEEPAR